MSGNRKPRAVNCPSLDTLLVSDDGKRESNSGREARNHKLCCEHVEPNTTFPH